MNSNSRWLSVEQVAQYLGISKETVYRWLEKGTVPAHRVGKLWRFQSQEIDAWVRAGGAAVPRRNIATTKTDNPVGF